MFSLTSVEQDKPFTIEQIANNMQKVFDQTHRLVILVDTTLEPDTFDQLKAEVGKEHIVNVPLAKGQKADNTPVFFIEIKEQSVFDKVKLQLVERISLHYNYDNSAYLVCGFGSSKLDNETLNDRFKKSLVLSDQKSEFLFRWYDPRVLIYLDAIFSEHQLNSLLGIFDHWHFIHPIGYFEWIKKNNEVFVKKALLHKPSIKSLFSNIISK
ncbi:DUF4123 domain-containing protein [Acinetobacter sp. YH16032]|uniref:DUF4123 domain-containing protein n=1 Tax=Acinetobacter sp. YH16032 TaxID=2601181 RepID=UPI0015D22D85|nr:DUF4123 domain-containing protein [Acinetobacter sp. YH16032]